MQNKDGMDEFLRKKTEEFDLPYSDQHWEAARQKLQQERMRLKKAALKKTIWLSGSAAAVLVTGVLVYLGINTSRPVAENMQQPGTTPSPVPSLYSSPPSYENNKAETEKNVLENPSISVPEGPVADGESSLPASPPALTPIPSAEEKNPSSSLQSTDHTDKRKTAHVSSVRVPQVVPAVPHDAASPVATVPSGKISATRQNMASPSDSLPPAPAVITESKIAASGEAVPAETVPESPVSSSLSGSPPAVTPEPAFPASVATEDAAPQTVITAGNETGASAPAADAEASNPMETTALTKPVAGISAGISAYHSLRNSSVWMADPYAGVSLSWNLHTRLQVTASGIITQRRGVEHTASARRIHYDFGKTVEYYRVNTGKMYYLEFPVHAGYLLGKRHLITAGGGLSYLLNTESSIQDFGQNRPTQSKVKGYMDGFAAVDYFLSAGYQYFITHRFRCTISGQWGLKDLSDNIYFGINEKNTNAFIRAGVSVNLNRLTRPTK